MELQKPVVKRRARPPRKPTVDRPPPAPVQPGQIQEPGVDFPLMCDMLRETNAVWLRENVRLEELRNFVILLDSVSDTARKRLQELMTQGTAAVCANPDCKNVLPHGRFAGEIIIRDSVTQELVPLRACSEPCYRVIAHIAAERRMQNQNGVIRGSVAL